MSVLEQSPEFRPEATPTATHEDESLRTSHPAQETNTDYPAPRAVPDIEVVDGKIRLAVAYAEPGYYTDIATRHEYVPELGRLVDPYAPPHDADEFPSAISYDRIGEPQLPNPDSFLTTNTKKTLIYAGAKALTAKLISSS